MRLAGTVCGDGMAAKCIHSRAGEFTNKNLYHGKNRVFGPKNAPKKFGSPTPNFPPPQFGK